MSHEDNQDNKLDRILSEITEIKVVQAEQRVVLEDHTRRSLANETNTGRLEELILAVRDGFAKQLRPIQTHVDRVQFLFVIVVGSGAVVGAVMTIIEALKGALK